MKKILFINHTRIQDPDTFDYIKSHSCVAESEWLNFFNLCKFNSGIPGTYLRTGLNTLPVKNDSITELGCQVPKYNPNFTESFADVTDQRCQELKTKFNQTNWIVLWSGGIDSTVLVTSILKNFTTQELNQVKIACSAISIYENPHFFYKHIQPNFEIVDSNNLTLDKQLFEKHIVIGGEPGDQLFASRMQKHIFLHPECLTKDVRKDPDQLLNFLSQGTYDSTSPMGRAWAVWFYETMLANIDSVEVPVINYHDFYWWYMFNATWAGAKIRLTGYQTENTADSLQALFNNFILWYDTDSYQQWAMNNNKYGVKYGNTIGEYKITPKQYIFDYDHNEWYFKFKTKKNSNSRSGRLGWDCILDDFTRLTFKDNREQILELLPAHIV